MLLKYVDMILQQRMLVWKLQAYILPLVKSAVFHSELLSLSDIYQQQGVCHDIKSPSCWHSDTLLSLLLLCWFGNFQNQNVYSVVTKCSFTKV